MEIKNYRVIDKGCLKSAFTVFIPEWGEQQVDATYFEKDNGSFWVNYASKEFVTKEGQKKSYNMTRWPQAVTERLNKAIRDKIKSGQVEHKQQQSYAQPQQSAAPVQQQQPWHSLGGDDDVPF